MTATTPPPGGTARLGTRTVARIGFGAMQLGERGGLPGPDRDRAITVLRDAVELGVDHVDTADFYGGDGVVNELIREALAPYDEGLALVSKVGARHTGADGLVPAQRPEELRSAVEDNLRHLGVERLALVNLRRMDGRVGVTATGDQVVDLDDQLEVMVALREEGKIEALGISTITADQLTAALPAGIACVQNAHSVLDRTSEPVLEVCRAHAIAWVPYFSLGSAFDRFPNVTDDPTVIAVAEEVGVPAARVALAWQLAHYEDTLLIPGTSDPAHLRDNLAVGDVVLSAEQLAALDAIAG